MFERLFIITNNLDWMHLYVNVLSLLFWKCLIFQDYICRLHANWLDWAKSVQHGGLASYEPSFSSATYINSKGFKKEQRGRVEPLINFSCLMYLQIYFTGLFCFPLQLDMEILKMYLNFMQTEKHGELVEKRRPACWAAMKLAEAMVSGCGFLRRRLWPSRRFLQLRLVSSNSASKWNLNTQKLLMRQLNRVRQMIK